MDRIDLSALDTRKGAEAGFELQLKHPVTGEILAGWLLKIRGYDAPAYQEVLREHQRRRLERSRNKRITVEELEAESLEAAAVLVMGWPDQFNLEGQPFAWSEANARALLGRFPWIREQVETGAADRGNFLPGSAKSS